MPLHPEYLRPEPNHEFSGKVWVVNHAAEDDGSPATRKAFASDLKYSVSRGKVIRDIKAVARCKLSDSEACKVKAVTR